MREMRAQKMVTSVTLAAVALFGLGCASEDAAVLSTSRLSATHDRVGPYRVVVTVKGRPDKVELGFSLDRGKTFVTVDMDGLGGATYQAMIPGAPPGTQVQYFASADDDRDPGDDREVFAFDVLPELGPCTVDSDCVPGEICSDRTCRTAATACSGAVNECGQGFSCDTARSRCVVVQRSCTVASERSACLIGEICDAGTGLCAPRLECGANDSCPTGFQCQTARSLCLRR
jgi:hypothetical protein